LRAPTSGAVSPKRKKFVNALDQHVEEGLRGHHDPGGLGDEGGQAILVGEVGGPPLLLEFRILRERFELPQLIEVAQTAPADPFGDQFGEPRIAQGEEAAGSDAVGHD
jgi:hypothetical protein